MGTFSHEGRREETAASRRILLLSPIGERSDAVLRTAMGERGLGL